MALKIDRNIKIFDYPQGMWKSGRVYPHRAKKCGRVNIINDRYSQLSPDLSTVSPQVRTPKKYFTTNLSIGSRSGFMRETKTSEKGEKQSYPLFHIPYYYEFSIFLKRKISISNKQCGKVDNFALERFLQRAFASVLFANKQTEKQQKKALLFCEKKS
ncbi:MAG TPA: hypothetical protein VL485_10645 [Ktedonobacteraceae bacterium]|jgi:hypothetical protein|nr:hypothetical protein [Ktedonobacteraceae bacterium]